MARMEIISGVERRRRWSKAAKLEILAEADQPGVRIGDVARRHDIYPAQIRLWRRVLSPFDAPSSFIRVQLLDEEALERSLPTEPRRVSIEIVLRNGRGLKVPSDIERKTLASLIACVEAS
ncbi:transposase [Brucella pseudogrignonensis]|uniref:IS66-like element accessory protein TnpA n=1 Tax=Brucella pseudogrignonensis TaxID=419475 RepID=UPI0028B82C3F|nr:transposase [Brucella pseudogrignonensis]MDT6941776.1 transposase [Brucella pseudogrignonensis]